METQQINCCFENNFEIESTCRGKYEAWKALTIKKADVWSGINMHVALAGRTSCSVLQSSIQKVQF